MYFVISWNENKETKRVGRIKVQPIVRNCPKKERPCRTARYGPPFSIAQIKSLNQGAKKSNFQEWIPWRRGTSGRGAQTGQLWGGHNYQLWQLWQLQLSTMTIMAIMTIIAIIVIVDNYQSGNINWIKSNYHHKIIIIVSWDFLLHIHIEIVINISIVIIIVIAIKMLCRWLSRSTSTSQRRDRAKHISIMWGLVINIIYIPDICHEPHEHVRVNFLGRCKFSQI